MNCVDCGERITFDYRQVHEGRARKRSAGKRTDDRCTRCAGAINGPRDSSKPAQLGPRYCTCIGTVTRTPGLREQCADCYRRIDPRYDDVPGDILKIIGGDL
jgi:hypothetical protein